MTLCEFEEGADTEYFKGLQEFANIVYDKCIGGPFPFSILAINDCEILVDKILKENPLNNSMTKEPIPDKPE